MTILEKFLEKGDCPLAHDRYVKEGKWQSHVIYCTCGCSYCMIAKLRKDYPDTGESGYAYDLERQSDR